MKDIYRKTYNFEIGDINFGLLKENEINEILKDGRHSSPWIEKILTYWFPFLKQIKGNKPYDHIDNDGNKYDAKNFTKYGCNFMSSSMIGTGRKFDYEKCIKKIEELELTYILCDIVEIPTINIKFAKGVELIKKYQKGSIPFKDRRVIFEK